MMILVMILFKYASSSRIQIYSLILDLIKTVMPVLSIRLLKVIL